MLTAFLIALLLPIVLGALGLAASRGAAPPGVLGYSRALKRGFLALAFGPSLLFGGLFVFRPPAGSPDDWPYLVGLLLFFPLVGSPLLLEAFGVRHTFDDAGVQVRSPWSRHRVIRWSDVASIRWRKVMKWLDLETKSGERLHVSPLMHGLEGFARAARAHLAGRVLEAASADARAVLALMEHGVASQLLTSPVPPAALLSTLGPSGR